MSVVISWMVSLPVGIISASRSNSVSDHVARAVSMVFLAIPGFWLAMLIMLALLCWFNYKALLRYAPAYIAPVSGALFGPSDHVFGGNNQYRGDPGFLEIGIPPPTPTWGNMLADSLTSLEPHWRLVFFPGLAIRLTGLAFSPLGDGIRDILDPRLRVALGRVDEELTKRCRVLPTPSMQRGERTGLQRYSGARSANISRSPCKRP